MKIRRPVMKVDGADARPGPCRTNSDESIIKHLKPLYLVSKLLSLSPFKLIYGCNKGAQVSVLGIVQSLVAIVLYGAFHLYTNYNDDFTGTASSGDPASRTKNQSGETEANSVDNIGDEGEESFVSVMIDIYSRYSSLGLYWLLVAGAVGNQRILIRCLDSFAQVDEIFLLKLSIVVRNSQWKRLICIQMAFAIVIILVLEWFNCLMYLSDYNPASEYCLPVCYLTLLTSITAESQFVGYVKLLQMRFQLINQLLVRFNELDSGAVVGVAATSSSSTSAAASSSATSSSSRSSAPNNSKFEINELWGCGGVNQPTANKGPNRIFQLFSHHHPAANNAFVKEMVPPRELMRIRADRLACRSAMKSQFCGKRHSAIQRLIKDVRSNANQSTAGDPQAQIEPKSASHKRRRHPAADWLFRHRINAVNPANSGSHSWIPVTRSILERRSIKKAHCIDRQPQAPVILIKSESGTPDHIRMEIINDIKNVYAHLHLLSLNINRAYGVQLIFILMTLFITLTTLLYYCSMKAIRILLEQPMSHEDLINRCWEVLSTLGWATICTYRMFQICYICNSTKNEASQIGSLVHGLGLNTNCIATKTMVKLLSLQLMQQKVEFTACGLFNIDHGLMFNIVGAVTTYILILLQFDIAQNKSKWRRLEQQ